eukprot:1158268-Pelagomonas_calceolata.AAC.4
MAILIGCKCIDQLHQANARLVPCLGAERVTNESSLGARLSASNHTVSRTATLGYSRIPFGMSLCIDQPTSPGPQPDSFIGEYICIDQVSNPGL